MVPGLLGGAADERKGKFVRKSIFENGPCLAHVAFNDERFSPSGTLSTMMLGIVFLCCPSSRSPLPSFLPFFLSSFLLPSSSFFFFVLLPSSS